MTPATLNEGVPPRVAQLLRDAEEILADRPYLRVDLGTCGTDGEALAQTVSVRLVLLHLLRDRGDRVDGEKLIDTLWKTEKSLVQRLQRRSDASATDALLAYETAVFLHPAPGTRQHNAPGDIESLSQRWERRHATRSLGDVVREKIAQNRDFFRHGAMLPLYWRRRAQIRRQLPDMLSAEPALSETLFAIEQVGPIVDNFAFHGAAGLPGRGDVALADAAFLYMQLADEFLDELSSAAGGYARAGEALRRHYEPSLTERPLSSLRLDDVRALGVEPARHTTRFGLTLDRLFEALAQVAEAIDEMLVGLPARTKRATHTFLHHCFETYLDEVELCRDAPEGRADQVPVEDVAWHFYRKNNLVMMLWLDLRAQLLGLDPADHAPAIRRWGYLLASFQVFDDLKDIAWDLGKQPSYPLQFAAQWFPGESDWLNRRFGRTRRALSRDDIPEVNRGAAATVQHCIRHSRLIALAHFDYALRYAWDQRWRKSWMVREGSFNPGAAAPARRTRVVERLVEAIEATRPHATFTTNSRLAFALDAAAYEGSWRIYWALFPNVRAMYRYATLRMWMGTSEKAHAARRLLARHPSRHDAVSVGLAEGDVDHQVASDRLEALAEPIEV